MSGIHTAVLAGTRMVVNALLPHEASALYLAVALDYGSLNGVAGFEKIRPLLTEEDGTKMHRDTRDAFLALCQRKLGEE